MYLRPALGTLAKTNVLKRRPLTPGVMRRVEGPQCLHGHDSVTAGYVRTGLRGLS